MSNFNYKHFIFMGFSSFLASIAFAKNIDVEIDNVETLDIPISFSSNTDFMNVACNGGTRNVVYSLKNTEANTINLDDIQIITNAGDTAPGLTIAFQQSGCIDTVNTNGTASGYIEGYHTGTPSCDITLEVTPPTCPTGGVLQQTIDRELYIGVQTREQSSLTTAINADVSVLGSGAYFALLASNGTGPTFGIVANSPAAEMAINNADIIGNIGSSGTSIPGDFSIMDGIFYNTQNTTPDVTYTAAIQDLQAAYAQLLTMNPSGCTPINGLDNESRGPSCYLLTPPSGNLVTVQNTITLTGNPNQNYYFYIDNSTNLEIDSSTIFDYPNGATPANVFWIMLGTPDAGQVLINKGAEFDGSVLSGATTLTDATAPAITTTSAGTSNAQINGTLWSAAPAATSSPDSTIQLYDDAVISILQ